MLRYCVVCKNDVKNILYGLHNIGLLGLCGALHYIFVISLICFIYAS